MASGTFKWFGQAVKSVFNEEIDLTADDLRCALVVTAGAPDQDADQYWSTAPGQLSTDEIAASGTYATGGQQLAAVTWAYTSGTNTWKFDADDVQWTGVTATFQYAVIYDTTPGTDKPLIGYIDFGSAQTVTAGTIQLTWDAAGIGTVVVS